MTHAIEITIHSIDNHNLIALYRKLIEKLANIDIKLESLDIDHYGESKWIIVIFEVDAENILKAKYLIEEEVLKKIVDPLLEKHQARITRFD